jgi:cysteine dioxygenase
MTPVMGDGNMRTIREFVDDLCRLPATGFSRESVLAEFGRVVIDPRSMAPYMFFSPTHYTRNLIHKCDLFEVIGIGWSSGQHSMIHNHVQQECWMGVTCGKIEVQNYRLVEKDPVRKTCRIVETDRYLLEPGMAAAVDPTEPIHSVHNHASFGALSMSVHVYSLPFSSCEVYQKDKGIYYDVPLDYTSVHGVLCSGETAECVGA